MGPLRSFCCGCTIKTGTLASLLMYGLASTSAASSLAFDGSLLALFTPILGIMGVYEKNPGLLMPFMVELGFVIVLLALVAVLMTVTLPHFSFVFSRISYTIHFHRGILAVYEVFILFNLILHIYIFMVVLSCYNQLKEEKLASPDTRLRPNQPIAPDEPYIPEQPDYRYRQPY